MEPSDKELRNRAEELEDKLDTLWRRATSGEFNYGNPKYYERKINVIESALKAARDEAAKAERERCAKECDLLADHEREDDFDKGYINGCENCAIEIREGGGKE